MGIIACLVHDLVGPGRKFNPLDSAHHEALLPVVRNHIFAVIIYPGLTLKVGFLCQRIQRLQRIIILLVQ